MHDGGLPGGVDHGQVGRQRRKRRIGALERRVGLSDDRPLARRPHAMHVDVAQMAQLRDKLGDVYPRTAVDLGRILPSHHRHPHGHDGSSRGGLPHDCY